MLIKEQIHKIYQGMTLACSPQAFQRNARLLMTKHGLPRHIAFSFSYSVLAWACERFSTGARRALGKEQKKEEANKLICLKRFLTKEEVEESGKYREQLESMEDGYMDPLKELAELDAACGHRTMVEQRPAVSQVVDNIEDDLKKGILVSLARMMREMGYDRWPTDPEGKEDIKRIIDAVSREMVKMGRRFNTLMRDQMRVLKTRGPKNYEKIVRRWLQGQPEGPEEKPGAAAAAAEASAGAEKKRDPEEEPETKPEGEYE